MRNTKVFNTVGINKAVSSIKQAVKKNGRSRKEIESAIEPLKAKIAQQDEFILNQTKEKQSIQEKNEELEQSLTSFKNELATK